MMNKAQILENVRVEDATAEHGVQVIAPVGPATVTVELPSWVVGLAVSKLRPAVDEAAEEYHELLDRIEEAAL